MARKFISFIIAASVAVTGLTAAPAQAGDRDLARALAAIAGVAIVGAVINESRKDNRYAAPRQYYQPQRQYYQPQRQYYQPQRQYYQPKRKYYQQPRHRKVERAYRHGQYQRRVQHRGYGQQRYSARPYY